MNRNVLIIAGVGAASLTIGAVSGYKFAEKKLLSQFEESLDRHIEETRDYFRRVYKTDDFETPEEAAEALGVAVPVAEAADAVRTYHKAFDSGTIFPEQKVFTPEEVHQKMNEVIPEEKLEKNIFEDGNHEPSIDKDNRDTSKPYVVDADEYQANELEHDQIDLTYYGGDNVLADDEDKVVEKVEELVGHMNLNMFGASDPEHPHMLLVRNERIKTDFEITYSDGKFAHEVLGFTHSDEPMSRRSRKREWDE